MAVGFLAAFGAYFAKLPILILYLRIFWIHASVRVVSWILLTVPPVLLAGGAVYGAIACSPENKVLDENFLKKPNCIQPSLGIGVWNGTIAITTDIVIFVASSTCGDEAESPVPEENRCWFRVSRRVIVSCLRYSLLLLYITYLLIFVSPSSVAFLSVQSNLPDTNATASGITASAVSLYFRASSLAGVPGSEVGQMLGQ